MRADGREASVQSVSDRWRNPFGMRPPCAAGPAVPGYGDPAADVHVIGDHPGRHGGTERGIPFTDAERGTALQEVLHAVGLLERPLEEEPPTPNLFLSYLHMCPTPADDEPSPRSYARLERYFDAELRAINAHILLPVGRRATAHVLTEYTTQERKVPVSMSDRHALEVRGRGFLVVPIAEPTSWDSAAREALIERLARILRSDYRQTKGVATMIG